MKRILLITTLLVSLHTFSQTNTLSWYKLFRGTIDRYPVTLHLHKAGRIYSGYYYYDSQQKPVYCNGEDSTLKGKIRLMAFTEDEEPEYLVFSIADTKATGQWKKTESGRPLVFSATQSNAPINFLYVFATGSSRLRPKWKESPEAQFCAASVWPPGTTGKDDLLKAQIRNFFSEKNSHEDIGPLLLRQKRTFLSAYESENKNADDDALKAAVTAYSKDDDTRVQVVFQSDKMITLAFNYYLYTGGAHGNYGTRYSCIDLTSNSTLTVDHVMAAAGKRQLQTLLEKNFRKQYHLKPTTPLGEGGLFEDTIQPNDNFYVTKKGIGFCYNPYEIGPYAMGEINIFIPFAELSVHLKEEFRKLID